jgi:hypothetical protein
MVRCDIPFQSGNSAFKWDPLLKQPGIWSILGRIYAGELYSSSKTPFAAWKILKTYPWAVEGFADLPKNDSQQEGAQESVTSRLPVLSDVAVTREFHRHLEPICPL